MSITLEEICEDFESYQIDSLIESMENGSFQMVENLSEFSLEILQSLILYWKRELGIVNYKLKHDLEIIFYANDHTLHNAFQLLLDRKKFLVTTIEHVSHIVQTKNKST
jgi:hypothetical protein